MAAILGFVLLFFSKLVSLDNILQKPDTISFSFISNIIPTQITLDYIFEAYHSE